MSSTTDTEAQQAGPRQRPSLFPIPNSASRIEVEPRGGDERRHEVEEYGDTSATYWNLYLDEAEINDKNLVESLESDTKSMELVNTIFSSIVASFIIEIYKTLQPNNDQQSSFKPSDIAVRMNIVMFLSLFLSMMSVVMSALIQQWCREFLKHAYPRAPPHKRGRVRTYLFQGLDHFQMRRFMYGVHVLLHVSVFLFFWAVSDFLYNVYQPVGTVALYSLVTSLVIYMAFSVSPLIFINSPYHTPLTPPFRSICGLILISIQRCLPGLRGLPYTFIQYFEGIRFNRMHFLLAEANSRAENLDHSAIKWLFTKDDITDKSMDAFFEALPGYILSRFTDQKGLAEQLSTNHITERIREHFFTCATLYWLSEEACIARVSTCVNSLRLIFKTSNDHMTSEDREQSQKKYIQGLISGLNELCIGEDPKVALRASCVRGLAFQGLLSHLTPPDAQMTQEQPFPVHLDPLYSFVSNRDNSERTQQPDNGSLSTEARSNPRSQGESKRMWDVLLNDGPLVNITLLAEAVLSHEQVQTESLSLCWKTLETLLKELSIARMKVSDSALRQFNCVLKKAHDYIHVEHRGFRVARLLKILDTVARGRHLSMVFLGHPKYYGRADVIFGKEQLRNRDLMEAFASCLPGYIANLSSKERMEFMEGMVCDDDLWTSLQVNLWNAVRSEIPITDNLRFFEACCAVIDTMFFALEGSDKVDWRAPDFGSLSQHFEMFVTNCFHGTFVGRATGFRVGLIKLRFCKAVLTKFYKEVRPEGAVSLRSQWDVASLARVFYTLEVGNEEDVEFWRSFTDGGHIGPEFMIKVREMLDVAIRDGPLLNFCKLGHLTVTAVPFAGSGLEPTDIEKVQALQETLLEDQDLPLTDASPEVWNELSRLRREVRNVHRRSFGKEREMLDRLLQMIHSANTSNPHSYSPHQLTGTPDPTGQSTHTPSHGNEANPHEIPSPQPVVHNRITSRVVNQIDILPLPTSTMPPRFSYIREPSRRTTMPTYLPTRREGSRFTANGGPPPTGMVTGPSSTLFRDPDPLLPDDSMGPLQESLDSSGDDQPISGDAVARDGDA